MDFFRLALIVINRIEILTALRTALGDTELLALGVPTLLVRGRILPRKDSVEKNL